MRFVSDMRAALADMWERIRVPVIVTTVIGVTCFILGLLVHAKLSATRFEQRLGS